MIKYEIIMPSDDIAKSIGVNLNGLVKKAMNWFCGLSFGLKSTQNNIHFQVISNNGKIIEIETNSKSLIDNIEQYLINYGIKISQFNS